MKFCNAESPEQCCYELQLIKAPAQMTMIDMNAIMDERTKLFEACKEYRAQLDAAYAKIAELQRELKQADETLEDVCLGRKLSDI